MENIYSTNKERDLLFANKAQIVSWGTETMPQRIQRHSRDILHRSTHPKWEQDQSEKSSFGLDWLQKACDMVPQSWIINSLQWCNGYRRRKWTRRQEFKSWTRLIAFHIALIPLGKVWIQLFSLQQWVNSRTDWVLQPWLGN